MATASQVYSGNSATLTKIDKLRERLGTSRISLPQVTICPSYVIRNPLVVVGDQSSGKSSVLEGITGSRALHKIRNPDYLQTRESRRVCDLYHTA
ncbi:hypothetical protein PG994_004281 [Apiospora phragmitis]|uniref:Dynamin N-terminal domain-containing protein n=1 Tax=Apiospora phragmitis TaxID=2905665 RepID=A0ABR1VQA1_9PEZI